MIAASHRKRSAISFAFAVSVFLIGCHSPKHPPKDINSVSITLQRTACYGICPVYTVTVKGNGEVEYIGERNVAVNGLNRGKIQPKDVEELVETIQRIRFFELLDHYEVMCTDQPTEIISVSIDGRSKRISNYFGCGEVKNGPQVDLHQLAKQIDAASRVDVWAKPAR